MEDEKGTQNKFFSDTTGTFYRCVRCGSERLKLVSDDVFECERCRARFVGEDGSVKVKIMPGTTKESFLRDAWLKLFSESENVPQDVFDCDFEPVETIEHLIAVKEENASEIGMGEVSSAFDMVSAGSSGDVVLGSDSQSHYVPAKADTDNFTKAIKDVPPESFVPPDEDELARMRTDRASEPYSAAIYLVPEYYTAITCDGVIFEVYAPAFGKAPVSFNVRETGIKPADKNVPKDNPKKLPEAEDERLWQKNRGVLVATTLLMLLSIVISVVLGIMKLDLSIVLPVTLILFAVALIVFVCGRVVSSRREAAALVELERDSEKSRAEESRKRRLALLNGKLESLCMKPASADEIRRGGQRYVR